MRPPTLHPNPTDRNHCDRTRTRRTSSCVPYPTTPSFTGVSRIRTCLLTSSPPSRHESRLANMLMRCICRKATKLRDSHVHAHACTHTHARMHAHNSANTPSGRIQPVSKKPVICFVSRSGASSEETLEREGRRGKEMEGAGRRGKEREGEGCRTGQRMRDKAVGGGSSQMGQAVG